MYRVESTVFVVYIFLYSIFNVNFFFARVFKNSNGIFLHLYFYNKFGLQCTVLHEFRDIGQGRLQGLRPHENFVFFIRNYTDIFGSENEQRTLFDHTVIKFVKDHFIVLSLNILSYYYYHRLCVIRTTRPWFMPISYHP